MDEREEESGQASSMGQVGSNQQADGRPQGAADDAAAAISPRSDIAHARAHGVNRRERASNPGRKEAGSRSNALPLAAPAIQRKLAQTGKTSAPQISRVAAHPFIQRAENPPTATEVEVTTDADRENESEREEEKTGNREQLLNDLARQIYPLVKRLIALERERRPFG